MARPPAPRALPYLYWGIHPLYFANVRMLAAHVNHCLDGTEPGRTDAHILYGHHPITKVEICGVVVDTASRAERRMLMVDDGTGVVQCALFLSNMDGSETSHYRAGVGEAVVIAGALNVGWKHGAMNEVCREIYIRSIRPTAHPDEQHAHWQETMRLHMQVYSHPVSHLIRVLDAGKVEALVRPMTAAATALAVGRRWDPFYDGSPLEAMLGMRVPPTATTTTTMMAAAAGDSSGAPARSGAAGAASAPTAGGGTAATSIASTTGAAAAADGAADATLIPIDVAEEDEEADEAKRAAPGAATISSGHAAPAVAAPAALCGVVYEALARFHPWERLNGGLDGHGLRRLVSDVLRASCTTDEEGGPPSKSAAVGGAADSSSRVQVPVAGTAGAISSACFVADGAVERAGSSGARAASHETFEALLTQGITVSGDPDGAADVGCAAHTIGGGTDAAGVAAGPTALSAGVAAHADAAVSAPGRSTDADVVMLGATPVGRTLPLQHHPQLHPHHCLHVAFTARDLLPLVFECAPPPFLEALGLLVPVAGADAAGGAAAYLPRGYAMAAGAVAAVHAALRQLQDQGRVIAVDTPITAVAPPTAGLLCGAGSLSQTSVGSLPSSQRTIPATPTRGMDDDAAGGEGDQQVADAASMPDRQDAAPPRVRGRTIVQHVLLALAAKHESGGNAVHAAAARTAAGVLATAAAPAAGAPRPVTTVAKPSEDAATEQHFVVVSVSFVVAPCVVALMQQPSPAVLARSKALGIGRSASAADAARSRQAPAPANVGGDGRTASGSSSEDDEDASATRAPGAAAGSGGSASGIASIADAARQQLLDLWTMTDIMAALTASMPLRRVPHAAVVACMARLQDANCVIAVGRDRYLIDHAAGL